MPIGSGDAAECRLDDEVTERHDEEGRVDQRQEHAVGRDGKVVHAGGAERQIDTRTRKGLHHRHHRPTPKAVTATQKCESTSRIAGFIAPPPR